MWTGLLEYCETFGLDPDVTDPSLATMARWAAWRKANAAHHVITGMDASDNWAKTMTKEHRILIAWAMDKNV